MTRERASDPQATLPPDRYRDPAGWDSDRERIFARAWHPLAPDRLPAEASSARPELLLPGYLDEALLLSRGVDGTLHALSNACTHRGALVCTEEVRARELRCPYHGRRFDWDGRYRSAPGFEDAPGFPSGSEDLPAFALGALGPLHAVSIAPALSLSTWAAAALERFDPLGWSDYRYDPSGDRLHPLRAHWALYVENYLEGFHVPFVHPGLSRALDLARYSTQIVPHGVLQIAEARADELAFELPTGHPDPGRRVAAWYLWLFPNQMLNLYPWGLSVNVVEPPDAQRSQHRYHRFVRDAQLWDRGAGAGLDQVESEDQAVVESVQRGFRSRLWQGGLLSPRHEQGLARFHDLWSTARQS